MCRRVAKDCACLVKGSHSLDERRAVVVIVDCLRFSQNVEQAVVCLGRGHGKLLTPERKKAVVAPGPQVASEGACSECKHADDLQCRKTESLKSGEGKRGKFLHDVTKQFHTRQHTSLKFKAQGIHDSIKRVG